MNALRTFFEAGVLEAPWAERVGWVLLHSLWQIALIAGFHAVFGVLLRKRSAQARYLCGCVAMAAMLAAPMATYVLLGDRSGAEEPALDATVVKASAGAVASAEPGVALPTETEVNPEMLPPEVEIEAEVVSAAAATELPEPAPGVLPSVQRWLPWVTAVWLVGVILLSLRPVAGWLHVLRLQGRGLSPLPDPLRQAAAKLQHAKLQHRLGVTRALRFMESALVEVPTVVGALRPMVLLPAAVVSGFPIAQIEMILAHELAHVRRHDYLVNLAQTVIEALFFFHPAVWWVSAQVRRERENCCDDIAVAVSGNRERYVQALTRLEEQRAAGSVAALAATGGSLLERVRRLLGQPRAEFGYRSAAAWLGGLVAVGLVSLALATGNAPRNEGGDAVADEVGQEDAAPAPIEHEAVMVVSDREAMLAYARALAAGDLATLGQIWEFQDDLDRQFAEKLAGMFARAEEMRADLVSMERLDESSLFACFLLRDAPEITGKGPQFVMFHRKDGEWRCSSPLGIRSLVNARVMGAEQMGRRAIAQKMAQLRFARRDGNGSMATMKAQRDAFARLARPPYGLAGFERVAEQMQAAIEKVEAEQGRSWQELWRLMLEEHGEEALPRPGDFSLSFYLPADPADPHARKLPFPGPEKTFLAEPFPCLTDDALREVRVEPTPDGKQARIELLFTSGGARLLEAVTRESIRKRLAIVVDGKVLAAPEIVMAIDTGKVMIEGSFTRQEAEAIMEKLNSFRKEARKLIEEVGTSKERDEASHDRVRPGAPEGGSVPGGDWGNPTELGLRTRLRVQDQPQAENGPLEILLDIRNEGRSEVELARLFEGCWLEVDGRWYSRLLDINGDPPEAIQLKAGEKLHAFETLRLYRGPNRRWIGGFLRRDGKVPDPSTLLESQPEHHALELRPGKHRIRLAYTPNPGARFEERIFAYTNLIEIEISAGKEGVKNPDNPLGLDNETLIRLFNTGKKLRVAAQECLSYQGKYSKIPKTADVLFEDYQQFAPQMIADPFAAEGGVLRLSQRTDEEGAIWLQVWSVGPDGDWDGGKPIDAAGPTLNGDLGAEMRIGKWAFNWLAGDTMAMHLGGKRLSHYLAAQGPEHPGAINPHQTLDWGPVVDGLCMAVKLVPQKESYTLGEKIGLEFHVRNVSRHPITIAGLSWRQDGGPDSLMIRNHHGENLEVRHSWFSGITPIQRETLKTGHVAVFKSSALAFLAQGMKHPTHPVDHTVLTTPGRHTLQFELIFPDGRSSVPDVMPRPTDWQGTLKTGVKEIAVVEQPNSPPKEAVDREKEEAANAAAEAMKSAGLVDSEARQRFLAVERFARLPQSEQTKRLPEFYRNLDSRALNPMVEGILSSYPHDILKGHQENDPFDGTTALWAGQLAGAADSLSPEQVADQLGSRLWLGVAARARALQVLRNHADATAALIGEDLASADKAAVERAGMAIQSLELRSFSDELLDLWLADDELSDAAWRTLVMLGDPGIVKPLLERVARDPVFLVRCSGLFLGPLAGEPALPQLVKLLDAPDAEIRYHAAYALQECRDPALAPWAVRLADEKEARFRFLAAHWIRMLPEDAFRAVRGDLLALLHDEDDEVRFYALKSFAEQKNLAAGPVILKLLRGDPPAEQHKVRVMQAMSALSGKTWGYDMHNWGPDKPGNQEAIEKLEGWLKQQGKNQPGATGGLEFLDGIPEFRELSLQMTEAQLPGIIRRHSLAATRDGSGNYHLFTRNGENVRVMFRGGECGIQRMRPDRETAESLLVSRHERLNECWRLYTEACAFLCDQQGDRAEAARRFTMAARSAPVSETGFRARELAVLLAKMAGEPRPRASREAPEDHNGDISIEEELEDLFFDLRNLAFRPALSGKWSVLGPASVSLRNGQGNPAARLRNLAGDEAIRGLIVPRLLAMLDDRRPTRSWTGALNGGHVLRHCDVALEILADLAGVLRPDGRSDFDSRTSRDDYLATADEQTRRKIIARVSACWPNEKAAWGEAVEGVQTRLTEVTRIWGGGDWPHPVLRLRYEARNNGSYTLHLPKNGLDHQVEVDGQWYEWVDPPSQRQKAGEDYVSKRGGKLRDFGPKTVLPGKVELAGGWRAIPKGEEQEYAARHHSGYFVAENEDHGKELVLTPGKHTIRMATICPSARASFHGVVRAVSNARAVEIGNGPTIRVIPENPVTDGIYRVKGPNSTKQGVKRQRSDATGTVEILERLTPGFGDVSITSMANDNSRFRIDFKGAGPFSAGDDIGHMAVVVDKYCVMIGSNSDPDGEQRMDLTAWHVNEPAANAIARKLGTKPEIRRNPGHKMDVTFSPTQATFQPGHPVVLRMTIKNVGDKPFSFMDGGQQRGPRNNQFGFTAFRDAGKGEEVPDTGDATNFGGPAGFITLKPGEAFEKEVDITKWFDLSDPDTYLIRGHFEMVINDNWDEIANGSTMVTVAAEEGAVENADLPQEIRPILQAMKQEIAKLGEDYPQLGGAGAVEVKPGEWLFEHDCSAMGKRGYENTGPFPVAIGLRLMTTERFREQVDKVAMSDPGYRWEYLGLVGWPTLHVADGVPPVLTGKLQEVLRSAMVRIGALNREALADSLPAGIRKERDRLLAAADAKIRDGVRKLADTYPLLEKGQSWDRLQMASDPGRIGIHAHRTQAGKGGTDARAFPPSEAFSILVVVKQPPDEIEQLAHNPLYPRLGLVGQVGTGAANPELDAALKKLVAEALAPLAELEKRAGRADDGGSSSAPVTPDYRRGQAEAEADLKAGRARYFHIGLPLSADSHLPDILLKDYGLTLIGLGCVPVPPWASTRRVTMRPCPRS